MTCPGVARRVCLAASHACLTGRTGYTRVQYTPSTNFVILTFKNRVHPRAECSLPYGGPTSRLETRPKRRRTRSHSRPISTPTTSKTDVYQPTVTPQHNPSRWIAGDSVTRYRYTRSVHTSEGVLRYSGRGMNRKPKSQGQVTHEQIFTPHAHRAVREYRTPRGFITAHSASSIYINRVHTLRASDAHRPPRQHRRANKCTTSQTRIRGL